MSDNISEKIKEAFDDFLIATNRWHNSGSYWDREFGWETLDFSISRIQVGVGTRVLKAGYSYQLHQDVISLDAKEELERILTEAFEEELGTIGC